MLNSLFVLEAAGDNEESSASLLCVQCKDSFQSAWDLMVHAQAAHMINIYELGVPNHHIQQQTQQQVGQDGQETPCQSPDLSPTPTSPSNKVRRPNATKDKN